MYQKTLELLNKGVAVDEARRRLREADREPDILQRFIKRGEALKISERLKKASMILSQVSKMSKNERKFLYWGCIVAGLLGGIFEAFFGFTPNVGAIIALTITSFTFSVAFMVALLVAPIKRVLWDTQDSYFIPRLRRLCNMLETSALTALTLCIALTLTPQTVVHGLAWTSAFVVWFNAYKTLGALSNCIQYPTNPY